MAIITSLYDLFELRYPNTKMVCPRRQTVKIGISSINIANNETPPRMASWVSRRQLQRRAYTAREIPTTIHSISVYNSTILFVQTFVDLVTFHPYIHALVSDGAFSKTGAFRVLPPIPGALLVEQLRHAVLDSLVEDEAITEGFANKRWPEST